MPTNPKPKRCPKNSKAKRCVKQRKGKSSTKSKSKASQSNSQKVNVRISGGQGGGGGGAGGGGGSGSGGAMPFPMPMPYPMHHSFATYDMGHAVRVNENPNGTFTRSDFGGGGNPPPAQRSYREESTQYYGAPPSDQGSGDMDVDPDPAEMARPPPVAQMQVQVPPVMQPVPIHQHAPDMRMQLRGSMDVDVPKLSGSKRKKDVRPDAVQEPEDRMVPLPPIRQVLQGDALLNRLQVPPRAAGAIPMLGVAERPRAIANGVALADQVQARQHAIVPRQAMNVAAIQPRSDAIAHAPNGGRTVGVQIRETRWDIGPTATETAKKPRGSRWDTEKDGSSVTRNAANLAAKAAELDIAAKRQHVHATAQSIANNLSRNAV
jgi:hypothetical protein